MQHVTAVLAVRYTEQSNTSWQVEPVFVHIATSLKVLLAM
jgi:hypothetical protein